MDLKAFYQISYGLYIISSKYNENLNGQIANVVMQITAEPLQIAICLNRNNLTSEYIKKSKLFSISVLSQDAPLNFIGKFGFKSGREVNKFSDVNYKFGVSGVPIVLDWTLSYFECEVVNSFEVNTHTIFIGKVIDSSVVSEGEPMTYSYYQKVKKGVTQKNAPTYIQAEKLEKQEEKMEKYKCKICGYIYDPSNGDPDNNIPAGTPFEKLPEDWVCPICGAPKSDFEKV